MDMKELLEKHFKEEALTEEVKAEMITIFDTAVTEAVNAKVEVIKKETEENLEEACRVDLNEFKENLVNTLNEYLEYAVSEFVKENEVPIVSEIKVSMAESTMSKLKDVLSGNFIKIDEKEIDVVKDLEVKVESLSDKLNKATSDLLEAKRQTFEFEKAICFKRIAESLSDNESEKLLTLVEDIVADNIEIFEKKVTIIKDRFIKNNEPEKKLTENLNENLDESLSKNDHLKKYLPKIY